VIKRKLKTDNFRIHSDGIIELIKKRPEPVVFPTISTQISVASLLASIEAPTSVINVVNFDSERAL
jgi:hypothetical protein